MARYGETGIAYGSGHAYGEGGTLIGIAPPPWTPTGGGNHQGLDWVVPEDLEISGLHYNVGRFEVGAGAIVTVKGYDGADFGFVEVLANDIEVAGALVGSAEGYRGGGAGLAGEGPWGGAAGVDGGYLTGAGQGDATTDESVVRGSGGGGGSTVSGGAGGAYIRLYSNHRLYVPATGIILAHGDAGGDGTAGNGAGGGIVLHCVGPFGTKVDGIVKTLGGTDSALNGGTLKRFTSPGLLTGAGTLQAGRLYDDSTLRRVVAMP